MDTYADALVVALDLKDVTLIGFSTGGGEATRYIGRHGTARVARAALVSAVPPLMLKTEANPGGLPIAVFDEIRAGFVKDRPQLFRDLSGPFFGANREGSKATRGMRDAFWLQGMQASYRGAPHGLTNTPAERLGADLLAFVQA
jgi:non-heme chloroperoxidase